MAAARGSVARATEEILTHAEGLERVQLLRALPSGEDER